MKQLEELESATGVQTAVSTGESTESESEGSGESGDESSLSVISLRQAKEFLPAPAGKTPAGKTEGGVTTSGGKKEGREDHIPVVCITPTTQATGSLDSLAATLLSNQLPPLTKFTGESEADETEGVTEWLEHLEMVAATCGRSDQMKLVNLITRL